MMAAQASQPPVVRSTILERHNLPGCLDQRAVADPTADDFQTILNCGETTMTKSSTEDLSGRLENIRAAIPLRHDDFRTNARAWSSDRGEKTSRFSCSAASFMCESMCQEW